MPSFNTITEVLIYQEGCILLKIYEDVKDRKNGFIKTFRDKIYP